MTEQDAAARVVTAFFGAVLSKAHDTASLGRFLSPEFVDHSAAGADEGPDGVGTKLDQLWAALPDGSYELLQVVSDGSFAAARSRLVGGTEPVEFADFYRVADGLIVEHWHVVDAGALARALGAS
jgi:predicted SnoaL-like aldol condensation-catalyzing enzyme